MLTLLHQPLCPLSRFVRLIMSEYDIDVRLVEERFWERREEFLVINPAGTIPVLIADGIPPIPSAPIIAEYIEETHRTPEGVDRLLPSEPRDRVEVRRLASWFNDKFHAEVSGPLVTERVFKRHMTLEQGAARRTPPPCAPRATISAIIWPMSAGWHGPATGCPATGSASPIWRRPRISPPWIIWATYRGTKTKQRGSGTRG